MGHYSLFKPHFNFALYDSSVLLQLSYFSRLILPISFVSILWLLLEAAAKQGGFSLHLEHIEKEVVEEEEEEKDDEPGGGNITWILN